MRHSSISMSRLWTVIGLSVNFHQYFMVRFWLNDDVRRAFVGS